MQAEGLFVVDEFAKNRGEPRKAIKLHVGAQGPETNIDSLAPVILKMELYENEQNPQFTTAVAKQAIDLAFGNKAKDIARIWGTEKNQEYGIWKVSYFFTKVDPEIPELHEGAWESPQPGGHQVR